MSPGRARAPATGTDSSSSSTGPWAVTTSARRALSGPSGPALWRGTVGAALLTVGGFGAGSIPVDGGPAAAVGLPGFTFGHGQVLALVLCWVGVALLVTSWLALGPRAVHGRLPARDAVWATALWSAPLLPSVPLFSTDAWTYLSQGAMAAAGISPYEHGAEANPGPFTDEVWQDWRTTTTPYGPLHVLLMRGIVAVSGGNPSVGIILLRVVVLAAIAGLVALVIAVARRTGVDAAAAVWMGCASPLTVVHLVGGLHNEVFPLVACLVAVVLALDSRAAGAGVAVGLAVAIKVNAVLVAPFLLWIVLARRRGDRAVARPVARSIGDTALAAITAAATFALSTLAAGLGTGWLDALSVSDRIINYLSIPTAVAHLVHAGSNRGLEDVLAVARSVGLVLLVCVLVAVWATHRQDVPAALRGIVLALLAFFLLNSVSWPWYYVWVAAFWSSARPGRRATTAAVAATVFLIMAIGPDGSTSLYSPALAAAAVVASLATVWWWHRATSSGVVRRPSPGRVS